MTMLYRGCNKPHPAPHGAVIESRSGLELREYGKDAVLPIYKRTVRVQPSYRICMRGHVIVSGLSDEQTKKLYARMVDKLENKGAHDG